LARLFAGEVVAGDLSATARVDQVVEARPVDLLALYEIEDAVQVREIVPGQGEAQTHPLAYAYTSLEAAHCAVERATHATEPIIDLADPVQADPDVRETCILDLARRLVGDERAVGRQGRTDA